MAFLGYWVRPDAENPDARISCESCRREMSQAEYAGLFKKKSLTFFALDVDDTALASCLCTKCFSNTIRLLSSTKNVEIEIITHADGSKPRIKHTLQF